VQIQLERDGDSELFEDLERYLQRHPTITRFLFNPAGFTFAFGAILALGILIGWLGVLAIDASVASSILAMTVAEMTVGREVAIPFGLINLGLPALIVFGVAFTVDLITTTWFYPLFYTFRRRQRNRRSFWGFFFRKIEQDAEARREFVQKYGVIGLFFFMLIPFAINGPLIGAIIGKLVGIRTRYILPTVILATATATGAWTLGWMYFRPEVEWFIDTFGGHWIALGIGIIFAFVLGRAALGFLGDIRRYRVVEQHRQEIAKRLQAASVTQVLKAEPQDETDSAKRSPQPQAE
jgi:uncharacterized membrane protein